MINKVHEISHLLPYQGFEQFDNDKNEINACIFKDGRIAFFYHVDGCEYEGWGPDDYKKMVQVMESSFRELPLNVTVQKTDVYFQEKNDFKPANDSYIEAKRCEHFNKRISIKHQQYIALTFHSDKAKRPAANSTNFATKMHNIPGYAFKDIDARLEAAINKANSWQNQMNQIPSVSLKKMNSEEVQKKLIQYLNLNWNDDTEEVHSTFTNDTGGLRIGHKQVNLVSLVGQSEELFCYGEKRYFSASFFNPWTFPLHFDLQVPHVVNTTITKVDMDTSLKAYKRELLTNKQLSGSSPSGQKAQVRYEVLDYNLKGVAERKDGFVDFSCNVAVFSSDQNELKGNTEKVMTAIKGMSMAKYLNETFDAMNVFMAGLPGNGWENVRCIKMPTENALPYFQWFKPYVSDPEGELMTDRFGCPVRIDLNRTDLTARNKIIIGPTGSGKSFTEGTFISTSKERKEIQVIIDKGGTYRQLMEALGGEYLEHKEGNPMRFNPFEIDKVYDVDSKKHLYDLTPGKTLTLSTFITMLWKNKDQGEYLENVESSFLYKWIKSFYIEVNERIKKGDKKKPTLKEFTLFIKNYDELKRKDKDEEYLKSIDFFNIPHFLMVMQPYTDGIYKDIFNNEEAMNLSDAQLICFDLEGVQQDKKLYPIITMLVIDLVLSHIEKYPDILKHVILDEAWSFFTGDMQDFIQYMYRTIRKLNGTASIITQSAADILDSELANALMQNTQIHVILNHGDADTAPLRKMLNDDKLVDWIETIRKDWQVMDGHGNKIRAGRELFIKRENKSAGIYAMEVPTEQYVLLTSMPEERNHFQRLLKKYPIDLAVEIWKDDKDSGKIKGINQMTNEEQLSVMLESKTMDQAVKEWMQLNGSEKEEIEQVVATLIKK